jgi:hypothetical protein
MEDMHPFEDIFVPRELAKKILRKLVKQLTRQGVGNTSKKGENTLNPPKIVVTSIIFL